MKGAHKVQKIEKPQISSMRTYDCPKCGEPMRWIDNCNVYVCDTCELFFRDDFRGVLFSTEFEPILEEAQKHFDAPMMIKEMECFGFSEENLKEYNVGYLPGGYWAWRNDDSYYGTLTFPMHNWQGRVSNVLGKHIGSDDKLDLARAIHKVDARAFGVFNIEAFWEDEVHVYSNPTDCLKALIGGQKNSACVCGKFVVPEVFAPRKIYLHSVLPMIDFCCAVQARIKSA